MLETERLLLQPLTYEQLVQYINCDPSLESMLKLNPSSRIISPDLKEALEQTILPAVADTTKNYLYSTLWTIISKADNEMVGDLCIVGEPDANGQIEIGYGTYEKHQGKGYMTEAVGAIINWAGKEEKVRSVFAVTEKANTASFTVLEKNNFLKAGEEGTQFHWRLILKEK